MKKYLNLESLFLLATIIGCAVALTGCGIVPKDRTSQEAATSHAQSETARDVQITKQMENALPPITANVSGTNNTVTISPGLTTVKTEMSAKLADTAISDDWFSQLRKVSIPLGVKLLLLAAGLLACVAAVWLVRRSSVAANAAYGAGDAALARCVGTVEALLRQSTDTSHNALLSNVQTVIEKERGKLAA